MTTVPLDQCLRILRFEENASEARHAGSTLSCRHIPGGVLDGYEGAVETSSSSSAVPTAFASVRVGFSKRVEASVTTLTRRLTPNGTTLDSQTASRTLSG